MPVQCLSSKGGSPFVAVDNGQNGLVTFDKYANNANCYVKLGKSCNADGVHVEFTYMSIEHHSWINPEFGTFECIDKIKFTWLNSEEKTEETNPQCGCLGDESHPTCVNNFMNRPGDEPGSGWRIQLLETQEPTKYDLTGTDAKVVLQSDNVVFGGKIEIKWKFEVDDEDIEKLGEEFNNLTKSEIKLIPVEV